MEVADYYLLDFATLYDDSFLNINYSFTVNWSGDTFGYRVVNVVDRAGTDNEVFWATVTLLCVSYNGDILSEVLPVYNYTVTPQYERSIKYRRIGSSFDINEGGGFPPNYSPDTQLYWLYSIGRNVSSFAVSVVDSLLSFSIGDFNFFTIILGGGFLIYCTWALVKFILPF